MGNEQFKESISKYLRARFSFLSIATWEEERVFQDLCMVCEDEELIKTKRHVYRWAVTTGMKTGTGEIKKQSRTPLEALAVIEQVDQPAVFILKDFHVYLDPDNRQYDQTIVRKVRDLVSIIEKSAVPKNVIFVSPTFHIPFELQKDVVIVDYDLPSFNEIKRVLDQIIEANRNNKRISIELSNEEEEKLIRAALGLTVREAENAFALSMVTDGKLNIESVDHVLKEKQQIIQKTGLLEYVKAELNMEDVGGLENIKSWLHKRDNSWLESAEQYGLPAPKGLLITGVPGCGKSLIAKATSSYWRLPLLKLDMGKIFSGIVGSSEENMRKAIQTAEAIAPAILWIDEIEKGLSGTNSSGDSGTSTRIFGTLLTWMQEKKKPVFVIATANNIEALPPELMRKGRFDEIFFVDLPTYKERKVIFRIHLARRLTSEKVRGQFAVDETTLHRLAELTEGFIGSEIEHVVITALFEAFSEQRAIEMMDLEKAIEQTIPLAVTQAEQIRSLREWANLRAVAATPRQDRSNYQKNQEVDQEGDDDIRYSRGGRELDF